MARIFSISFLLLAVTAAASVASASPVAPALVDVQVVDDLGRAFPVYPVKDGERVRRAYVEAVRDRKYRIRVVNRSPERVGLVIAVDGRNIISGERSNLKRNERMYVLNPYGRAEYGGWRTDQSNIHRFFFTDAGESYSAAFGDYSAMGVIAVAVYREVAPKPVAQRKRMESSSNAPAGRAAGEDASGMAADQAGTGFGDREHSPSVRVEFKPKRRAMIRHFYKYEWRERLCDRGVVHCERDNRFWPDDVDYAPYPPGYLR